MKSDAAAPLTLAERARRALSEQMQQPEPLEARLLAAVHDEAEAVRTVADAFVPSVADWCFLDLLDEHHVPRRVAVVHADPRRAHLAGALRSVAPGPDWATPAAQSIRDGTPRLVREVTEDVLRWATHDDAHLTAFRAIDPASILTLPLEGRERVIGALTLIRGAGAPPFHEGELPPARRLARLAALALDAARALASERHARRAAESAR